MLRSQSGDLSVQMLSQKETWSLQQAWRKIFARRLHRRTGRWSRGAEADRHIFHPETMKHYLTGAAAEAEYEKVEANAFYIIDDSGSHGELRKRKPDLAHYRERLGVIIFPDDFDWTIAVGPDYFDRACFAYQKWVEDDDFDDSGSE